MTDSPLCQPSNEMHFTETHKTESFNAWNPEITAQIDALVRLAKTSDSGHADISDLVREMIVTALKAQHSGLSRADAKILSRSMRELRYGFRVFQPYQDRPKVTIFGSARTRTHDMEYKQARAFARKMVKAGFMVITGAGPGIMQAGNQGAGPENSFGVNIRLPYEQSTNPWVDKNDRYIDCRFFFTRKLMFVREANAVALFPGGFGTHDEGMEVLTLVQTGKADPMPIVMVDSPNGGYWKEWDSYVRKHFLKKGKVAEEDFNLFKITDSISNAVEEITNFYHNYHSLRYVKDRLVIRVQRAVPPEELDSLNERFKDILLKEARFTMGAPLPEEKEHPHLPRLLFGFNRVNYGRLRQVIDALNKY